MQWFSNLFPHLPFKTVGLLLQIEASEEAQCVKQIKMVKWGWEAQVLSIWCTVSLHFWPTHTLYSLQDSSGGLTLGAPFGPSHHCIEKPVFGTQATPLSYLRQIPQLQSLTFFSCKLMTEHQTERSLHVNVDRTIYLVHSRLSVNVDSCFSFYLIFLFPFPFLFPLNVLPLFRSPATSASSTLQTCSALQEK